MSHFTVIPITANSLAGVDLFRQIDSRQRAVIAPMCHGRRYSAGTEILASHDNSREIYFLVSGVVRVTYFSRTGKEIAFRDQEAGQMFGELSAIDGLPRSAEVIAHTDVVAAVLNQSDFMELICRTPVLAERVLRHLSSLVRLLSDRVIEFSTLGVNNRIHAELLRLSSRFVSENGSARISPVPTHFDLASRVSTHREAVTRELRRLESKGLLTRNRDEWVITDYARLQLMVKELLGP